MLVIDSSTEIHGNELTEYVIEQKVILKNGRVDHQSSEFFPGTLKDSSLIMEQSQECLVCRDRVDG